ncbi:MAG: DUF4097 domain-containing protein [Candidatus Aminicenantes bacterium]|nr:DUF4097 domain-containing protein [Candidatus Aminicenantes bacterium]
MGAKKTAKWMAVLACLLFFVGVAPILGAAKEKYEEKFSKTVSLAKDGEVTIENVSGSVEVKTWDKGEVKIDATKVSSASTLSRAKENAAKVEIIVEKEGNTLNIGTEYPERRERHWGEDSLNVSVSYMVMIPAKAAVKVYVTSGNVDLEGIGGMTKVKTTSGRVELRKASQDVDLDVVSGRIDVQDVTGNTYLHTISGNITAEGIKGSIKATVVSGDIDLRDVSEADTVEAKITSGSVSYEGEIRSGGRYTLTSHSGSVEMIVPAGSKFEFEAKTFSGRIYTDFEVKVSGEISKRKLSGVVNDGGAVVELTTFSGSINLKKR